MSSSPSSTSPPDEAVSSNAPQDDLLTAEDRQPEAPAQDVSDQTGSASVDRTDAPADVWSAMVEAARGDGAVTVAEDASAVEKPATDASDSDGGRRREQRPREDEKRGQGAAAGSSAGQTTAEAPMEPTTTFEDVGLSGELLNSIKAVGYEEPTPIQLATIPVLLDGKDVIAQAQTGSGKTAAFGFPIIETLNPRGRHVQALILCPTRELAIQVAEALHKYGRHKSVETLPIYGGQAYERQFRGLQRGVQIVVGTPGRVMDHMRRGTLDLQHLQFFVLDEADEMLDMGFIEDIEWILEQVPEERQTALFSATMPPRIVSLAQRYMKQPQRISVAGKQMTVPETTQSYYEVPRARKTDALSRILDAEEPTSTMIFCRTKHMVDELGESLLARGYATETLHGDLSQAQRDRVMRRFRGNQADILIATDVAARGLDVPDVSHVINYDIPESAEAYVHRIGRTGRAGRSGEAITLITPRETRWLRQIERIVKARIESRRLPTLADVAERRREAMKLQIEEVLKDEDALAPYIDVVDNLSDDRDAVEIAAAILKLYADETGRATTPDQKEDDLATFASADRGRRETGMTRLLLNVGRNQGIRPQDIVGAIANEAAIPGRSIGAIDILDASTYVDVPSDVTDRVIAAVNNASIKGRPVNASIAQPGGGRPDRDDRGGGRPGGYQGGGRSDRSAGREGGGSFRRDGGERGRSFGRGGPSGAGGRSFDRSHNRPPRDRD